LNQYHASKQHNLASDQLHSVHRTMKLSFLGDGQVCVNMNKLSTQLQHVEKEAMQTITLSHPYNKTISQSINNMDEIIAKKRFRPNMIVCRVCRRTPCDSDIIDRHTSHTSQHL